jgi:hypothetical protein
MKGGDGNGDVDRHADDDGEDGGGNGTDVSTRVTRPDPTRPDPTRTCEWPSVVL